jgi:hypothetical protein
MKIMKTIFTVSALALLSNFATAESFTYEQQIASPDLSSQDFISSGNQAPTREVRVSLNDWYSGNPDVVHVPYDHDGIVIRSPLNFTAYEELSRQNPDLGGV